MDDMKNEKGAPREARDDRASERTLRDRSDDSMPERVVGERRDELDEDDDLLPRRVVGEEMISREVRDQVTAMKRANPERESDVYNLTQEALRADPYGEDLTGSPPIEDEPQNRDIMPDQIQSEAPGAIGDDDVELTARSDKSIRPITSDELPEG